MSFPGKLQPNYRITNNDELLDALNPVPDFENRDDIKPWIHKKLDSRSISLVIERSDASKVVFKCKNRQRKTSTPRSSTTRLVNGKTVTKRIRTSPEDSCPFRLRVSYSVKHKVWAVNIIKPEHNLCLCANFGDGSFSTSSTPASTTSKRSWASTYTPASTTSPIMSITNSPASSLTPASEHMDFDFEARLAKKARTAYESPLSHEVDPLEKLSLPEDLSDLNHLVPNNELQITQPITSFDDSFDYADSFDFSSGPLGAHQDDLLLTSTDLPSEKLFESNLENQMTNLLNDDLFGKIYNNPMKLDTSLNIAGQPVPEDDEDPLMYLLSSSNSRYSLEELENLDKAMGVDANDKFLMSMFNKM